MQENAGRVENFISLSPSFALLDCLVIFQLGMMILFILVTIPPRVYGGFGQAKKVIRFWWKKMQADLLSLSHHPLMIMVFVAYFVWFVFVFLVVPDLHKTPVECKLLSFSL